MAVTKQIRLNPAGHIVPGDRRVHVSQDDGSGAADQVAFRYVGSPHREYAIDFTPYLSGSPFDPPNEAKFAVPIGGVAVRRVSRDKEPGAYKYDVIDSKTGEVTDDPDVIID
jgi:hypothetical protein